MHSQSRTRKTTPRGMWPPPPRGQWVDHPQLQGLHDAPGATKQLPLHHLRYQAALTLPRRTIASERDFSQARLQRKAFVSSDHLPPTSPAITTIRTRPCSLSALRIVSRVWKPAAENTSENPTISRLTEERAPGNRLLRHKRRFANLPNDLCVIQAYTEARFMNPGSEGQSVVTAHNEESQTME